MYTMFSREIRNNPFKNRLAYELKRNFRLNDLLQESVKILEKDSVNSDLVKRIKEEIIIIRSWSYGY